MAYDSSGLSGFRRAEKLYKLQKRRKGVKEDFSRVIDFSLSEQHTLENQQIVVPVDVPIITPHPAINPSARIFRITTAEGFYFIQNAITPAAQASLGYLALWHYPNPSNISNLDAVYGKLPIVDALTELVDPSPSPSTTWTPLRPQEILTKLRWVTLGYHYDWTARRYSTDLYTTFPTELGQLSAALAELVGYMLTAEAGIVNYYHADSMLCGHKDDAEQCHDAPVVSLSLGSTCVFLLGGASKDTEPLAMFLRSGDVVLMGGPSRLCVHGVPRILAGTQPSGLRAVLEDEHSEHLPWVGCLPARHRRLVGDYLAKGRINLNVRQVWDHCRGQSEGATGDRGRSVNNATVPCCNS